MLPILRTKRGYIKDITKKRFRDYYQVMTPVPLKYVIPTKSLTVAYPCLRSSLRYYKLKIGIEIEINQATDLTPDTCFFSKNLPITNVLEFEFVYAHEVCLVL